MQYTVFTDIDQNYCIHFWEEGMEEPKEFRLNPKTAKPFTREEAYEYAESIVNPKPPKTKQEFFEMMSDEDYGKYLEAHSVLSGKFANIATLGEEEQARVKAEKILITKFELRPDFDFSKEDIKALTFFCKDFDISVINSL